MVRWPTARLGEIAPLVRRPVSIDPETRYTEIGVRSFYRGTFHRRTVPGSEFGWQKLFHISEGDLIFSNLMAWEQAIAVAGASDHGCVGNHRMLTCAVDPCRCVPGFLLAYFMTKQGFAQITKASPGSIARNKTLSSEQLLNISVPVPPLDQQQRLVEQLDQISALAGEAQRLRNTIGMDLVSLLKQTERQIWPERVVAEGSSLDSITTFLSRGRQSKQGSSDHFLIKSQHVQMGFYRATELTLAPWVADKVSDAARVQKGDVLIACSAAGCLGRVALFEGDGRVASTDTHVAIARADRRRILPEYLFAYLRSAVGQHQLRSREQGSLGRERTGFRLAELNMRDLRQVPVPVPPIEEQRRIVAELGAIRNKLGEAERERAAARTDLDVLVDRLLQKIFGRALDSRQIADERSAA